MEFLASDAGRGLALLRFTESPKGFGVYALPLNPPELKISQNLSLIGYPAASDDLLVSDGGIIKNLEASTNLFVELSTMLEVAGAHSEFGMSGGAAFSEDGIFRGILSHQIEKESSTTTLLISEPTVRQWISSVLTAEGTLQSPSPIALFQDPAQQMSDFVSYRTGFLYITEVQPFGPQGPAGMEMLVSKSYATETLYAPWTLARAQDYLKVYSEARLRALYFRKNGFGGGVSAYSANMVLNMKLLSEPTYEPLWTVKGYNTERPLAEVESLRQEISAKIRTLDFSNARRNFEFVSRLLQLLNTKDGWVQVKPRDIAAVLQDPTLEHEWKSILTQREGPKFKVLLETLQKTLNALTF